MLTKRVKNRIIFLVSIIILSVASVYFILSSLNKNILYFKTPTEINQEANIEFGKIMRVGGMVKKGSIIPDTKEIKFIITDFKNELIVNYSGTVPNLFLEGKGVIAEGKLRDKKYFVANKILAKHDENYMPPELKGILKNNVK
jgi:cytochrome c-type biogenesis protein CcmE